MYKYVYTQTHGVDSLLLLHDLEKCAKKWCLETTKIYAYTYVDTRVHICEHMYKYVYAQTQGVDSLLLLHDLEKRATKWSLDLSKVRYGAHQVSYQHITVHIFSHPTLYRMIQHMYSRTLHSTTEYHIHIRTTYLWPHNTVHIYSYTLHLTTRYVRWRASGARLHILTPYILPQSTVHKSLRPTFYHITPHTYSHTPHSSTEYPTQILSPYILPQNTAHIFSHPTFRHRSPCTRAVCGTGTGPCNTVCLLPRVWREALRCGPRTLIALLLVDLFCVSFLWVSFWGLFCKSFW